MADAGRGGICLHGRCPSGLVLALLLGQVLPGPACASDTSDIAGDYVCRKGCRDTDAPPGIAIEGDQALCMSELGGIYTGRRMSRTSVACFRMVGTLTPDGRRVLWSKGNIWERRSR